jgi:hypothetical protein
MEAAIPAQDQRPAGKAGEAVEIRLHEILKVIQRLEDSDLFAQPGGSWPLIVKGSLVVTVMTCIPRSRYPACGAARRRCSHFCHRINGISVGIWTPGYDGTILAVKSSTGRPPPTSPE